MALSESRKSLTEQKLRNDELKEELETQKREYSDEISVFQERIELLEQEFERAQSELVELRSKTQFEESERKLNHLLDEKEEELMQAREEMEVSSL